MHFLPDLRIFSNSVSKVLFTTPFLVANSKYLASKIQEKLALKRVVSDIIIPGDQKIYVCTGCMDCDKKGVCDFDSH